MDGSPDKQLEALFNAQDALDVALGRLVDAAATYRAMPSVNKRAELHAAQGGYILAEVTFFHAWEPLRKEGNDDVIPLDLARPH